MRLERGAAEPLGVTLTPTGANVAIAAPDATAVFLCVFDAADREIARLRLSGRTGAVHHAHVVGLAAGARYGLRAEGPWNPAHGHRFNPAKLLIDPWARRLDRKPALHPSLFDTGDAPDAADSGPFAPKAVLEPPLPATHRAPVSRHQIIYELHVRGFTARHPDVPEALRGTFAGLAHPAARAHLTRLGVTMVELLPAAAWIDERHLPPLGLTNYWGYNPVAFLAPDPLLAPGGMPEVREAVAALQADGIAVVQDVVFNHTGEGDDLGPTLSLKGLGNAAHYRLEGDARAYVNDSGCGNTLAKDRPHTLRLVMDAMRHWVEQAGLDGFRLDLATTLARRPGFDPDAPLMQAIRQDPVLRPKLFIAEPWDIGADGYQLGRFPAGWGEWNDRFRDDSRRFWRGDAGMLGALATRLAGSADIFGARAATDSVNFITAHDGFTLSDLVSFSQKRNHANGEQNRDGTDGNHSWNGGVEGPTDDAGIRARRAADARALLATLLLARGTPMLAMGDEAGRSQGGNNNAYAQDGALSWFDWAGADTALVDFTARMIAARRTHPALHEAAPLTGAEDADGLPDVAWLRPDGAPMQNADWGGADALVMLLHAAGDRCLLAVNGGEARALTLPPPRPGQRWRLLADSSDPGRAGLPETLPARAVLLLAEEAAPGRLADDSALLGQLARAAGIATSWHAISGTLHLVPQETLRALLGALGLPAGNAAEMRDSVAKLSAPRAMPQSHTLRDGTLPIALADRPVMLRITAEDGRVVRLDVPPDAGATQRLLRADGSHAAQRLVPLPALPPGRHRVVDEATPDALCHLLVAPPRCHLPADIAAGARRFGVAAQLYALRRAEDQGVGDFTALAELARLSDREGAALLGLSPPHALFPTDRGRASPYQPSDRRFLDPIFLDVAELPLVGDLPSVRDALAAHAPVFAALRAQDSVDHAAVAEAKLAVLRAAWNSLPMRHPAQDALTRFRQEGGAALDHFCIWNVLAAHHGTSDSRAWPDALRASDGAGVAAFAKAHENAIGFVAFQQMLADAQLGAAGAAGAGLYRDLAVGAAPDGAEAWSGEMRVLPGFSIGAPPDPFSAEGQVWGLPPPDPRAGAADGHAGFARLIRANMRHAAALRVDHVLGLRRLFLVPEGARGSEGAYLAQPFDDLLADLALESTRARCVVVGEDLGTVPEGMGEALREADVLSYRVLWFERQGPGFVPPARWPARAAACVATHDLPTLAGFWSGADMTERAALGLLDAHAAEARAADKRALMQALRDAGLFEGDAEAPMTDAMAAAIHALVASTPSSLMLVQAEDLAGAEVAVNLPGTDQERPNWRARLSPDLARLFARPRARAILDAIRHHRG
jgi:glycogen operon protein